MTVAYINGINTKTGAHIVSTSKFTIHRPLWAGHPSVRYPKVSSRTLILSPTKLPFFPADNLLCAPGQLHELETRFVDGRLQRVYKNLWPTLRVRIAGWWRSSESPYADRILEFLVLGGRPTFQQDIHRVRRTKIHIQGNRWTSTANCQSILQRVSR
jgi:hypothetical protein